MAGRPMNGVERVHWLLLRVRDPFWGSQQEKQVKGVGRTTAC